jgi:hypothetical protein
MSTIFSKIIAASLFFLLVFLSGYWLNRTGKPYSTVIFTIHKLISLSAILYLGMLVARVHQAVPLQSSQWLAIGITAACLVITMITGGLLSLEKAMPVYLLKVHQILPYLTVISIGVSLYLLLIRDQQLAGI